MKTIIIAAIAVLAIMGSAIGCSSSPAKDPGIHACEAFAGQGSSSEGLGLIKDLQKSKYSDLRKAGDAIAAAETGTGDKLTAALAIFDACGNHHITIPN